MKRPKLHCILIIISFIATYFIKEYFIRMIEVGNIEQYARDNIYTITFFGFAITFIIIYQLIFIGMLLFKEKWRESVFYTFTGTSPQDELEEKAVLDSMKRSFILSFPILLFLTLFYENPNDAKRIEESAKNIEKQEKVVEVNDGRNVHVNIDKEKRSTEVKINLGDSNSKVKKSVKVKASVSSPEFLSKNGALIVLLFQLISFRVFLYLNLKKYQ